MPATPIQPPDLEPEWDVVDEASWESFPASDPPAWSQHRAVASPQDRLPVTLSPHYAAARRRRRRIIGGVALALGGLVVAGLIARAISGRADVAR